MISNDNILPLFISGSGGGGGKGGGGGSSRIAQEAPNTLQSKATLRAIELLGEGENVGLVDGAKSIYFDNTPLQNSDGSYNFTGITFAERTGTPDQEVITGFHDVEEEKPEGVKVTHSIPIVRTITDYDTDAVRITIRIPALTEQNTSNGDLNGSQVAFKIEYQPNGGSYITAIEDTIVGKTVSPYEQQYRFNLTGSAPWNIRFTRVTPDNTAANIQNDIYWSSYTRIIDHKLIYPDDHIIGLEIDSSLFSNIPTRSYRVKGKIINVPSNYDPETREYTGVWDGTFQLAYSNNPAWVLYDLMINDRYGVGSLIVPYLPDKWALYECGQYSDEMVDNGAGGLEPRFTFNGIIQTQEDALRVLQTVASVMRAMVYWGVQGTSGVITVAQDSPKDPIKLITNSNVYNGSFNYSGSSLDVRHTACFISYTDLNDPKKIAVEVVEDQALIAKFGYRKKDIVAFACTSRGQAHRAGRSEIYSDCYLTEVVNFSTGLADADIAPSQILSVMDSDYSGVRFSGRIISVQDDAGSPLHYTGVTIDAPVTLASGESYTISMVMPDGMLAEIGIINSENQTDTLTFATPLTVAPLPSAVWVLTSSELAPRQFSVLAMQERSTAEFETTALLYDQNKYAYIDNGLHLPTLNYSKISRDIITPPSDLHIFEYLARNGQSVFSAATISWKSSNDSRVVRTELEARRPNGSNNYERVDSTSGVSVTIVNTIDGVWSFRARSFDALGRPSAYVYLENINLSINSTPPDDVTAFSITSMGNTSTLTWKKASNLNISHYEIRYSTVLTGAEWNSSVTVLDRISANSTTAIVPTRSGTWLIKAVTNPTDNYPSGIYSNNAALITTDIDALLNFNFVDELVEHPTFAGTKTNVEVSGSGNLELSPIFSGLDFVAYETQGTYDFPELDLGAIYTNRITPRIVASGNLRSNIADEWANVDEIVNVDGITDGQWKVEFQISTTNDDPSGSPVWSDYRIASIGDYNFRAVRPRVVLYSYFPTVTPSIEELSVQIDMPDLIQSGNDIVTDATGTNVIFGFAFKSTDPRLGIATQNMATGDYYTITAKSATGFSIRFFNAAGTGISRTFDYVAKGYGILTP